MSKAITKEQFEEAYKVCIAYQKQCREQANYAISQMTKLTTPIACDAESLIKEVTSTRAFNTCCRALNVPSYTELKVKDLNGISLNQIKRTIGCGSKVLDEIVTICDLAGINITV